MFESISYNPLILIPTRLNNIIDHIWTNINSTFLSHVIENEITDHFNSNSFDETVKNAVRKINVFYNNYCPVRLKAVSADRMSKPWLAGKILKMIQFQHFLCSQYKKLIIPHYIYSNFNTRLNNIIRSAKKFHVRNQFEKKS